MTVDVEIIKYTDTTSIKHLHIVQMQINNFAFISIERDATTTAVIFMKRLRHIRACNVHASKVFIGNANTENYFNGASYVSTLIIRGGSASDLENLVLTSAIFHSAQASACSYPQMRSHSFDRVAREKPSNKKKCRS